MTLDTLLYAIGLFVGLFVFGTVLCFALYKWDIRRYFSSSLWVKTYYWIPIFAIFLTILHVQLLAAFLVTLWIGMLAIRELYQLNVKPWYAVIYTIALLLLTMHLVLFFVYLDQKPAITLLLIVGFSSVLSDVFAYFSGNFIGRHKLPQWINPNKSWEGVAGQLIGAIVGFLLIAPTLDWPPYIILAILIGISSAVGDILNSIVKRRLDIKDWGRTIPGHGGMLDRFASLSCAIATAYWFSIFAM